MINLRHLADLTGRATCGLFAAPDTGVPRLALEPGTERALPRLIPDDYGRGGVRPRGRDVDAKAASQEWATGCCRAGGCSPRTPAAAARRRFRSTGEQPRPARARDHGEVCRGPRPLADGTRNSLQPRRRVLPGEPPGSHGSLPEDRFTGEGGSTPRTGSFDSAAGLQERHGPIFLAL